MATSNQPVDDDLSTRLARCYTGAIHDVLRAMGHEVVGTDQNESATLDRLRGE